MDNGDGGIPWASDGDRLLKLLDLWSITTKIEPKRYDGDWHARYTWKAEINSGPEQGRTRESPWKGFSTHTAMVKNMLETLTKP
jgi:hypothetical protein